MIPLAMTEWGDILTNKILTTVSVILFLLYLGDLFKLMPSMMYSIGRPRGVASFEHNVSMARIRNRIMHPAVLPDCGPFLPIRAVIPRRHPATMDFSSPGGSPHRISFIPPDSACEHISQTAKQGQRPGSKKKSLFLLYSALLPDDSLFRCNDFFQCG